jgi:hypothetical protein
MNAIPLKLAEANAFVAAHHRHHKPVRFHLFSIGAQDKSGQLIGAAIVMRPVSQDDLSTVAWQRCVALQRTERRTPARSCWPEPPERPSKWDTTRSRPIPCPRKAAAL